MITSPMIKFTQNVCLTLSITWRMYLMLMQKNTLRACHNLIAQFQMSFAKKIKIMIIYLYLFNLESQESHVSKNKIPKTLRILEDAARVVQVVTPNKL